MLDTWNQFLSEYIKCHSATEAYMRVHKNTTRISARELGNKLLKKPEIIEALALIQKERVEKAMWTAEEILQEIKDIAHWEGSSQTEKLKALELAAKSLGMFRDKVEHSGSLQIVLDKEIEEWAE